MTARYSVNISGQQIRINDGEVQRQHKYIGQQIRVSDGLVQRQHKYIGQQIRVNDGVVQRQHKNTGCCVIFSVVANDPALNRGFSGALSESGQRRLEYGRVVILVLPLRYWLDNAESVNIDNALEIGI